MPSTQAVKVGLEDGPNETPNLFDPSSIDPREVNNYNADYSIMSSFKPMAVLRTKVIVVGDAESGKTSLIQSFLSQSGCSIKYNMTTDVDLTVGGVPVPETDVTVDLFLYDIPGHRIFDQEREFQSSIWNGANHIVCCYDISSRRSFENCSKWIQFTRGTCAHNAKVLVLANKTDLRENATKNECDVEVSANEGKKYAEKHGFEFFQCSALKSICTKLPFQHIARITHDKHIQGQKECAQS